jgi:protein-disulfide isomerase
MNGRNVAGGIAAATAGAIVAVVATHGLDRGAGPPAPAPTGESVQAYLLDHPDALSEAVERYQDKQSGLVIDAHRAAIETPFAGASAGNPKGDVTLVEYFDYACGFCRATVGDIDKLVASDPGVRVVFKELPILSPWSAGAARLSLVAARSGKFGAFHHALYAAGPLDAGKVARIGASAGLDAHAAESPAIAAEIETNLDTARALHLSGTPTFVVGDQLLAGAVGYQGLKDAVDKARAAKKV